MKPSQISGESAVLANFVYDSFRAFSRLGKGLNAEIRPMREVELELPITPFNTIPLQLQSMIHNGYFIVQSRISLPEAENLQTYEELVMRAIPDNQGKNLSEKDIKIRLEVIQRASEDSIRDQLEQLISESNFGKSDYELVREHILKNSPVPVETDLSGVPLGFDKVSEMDLLDLVFLLQREDGRKAVFGTTKRAETDTILFLGARNGTIFKKSAA